MSSPNEIKLQLDVLFNYLVLILRLLQYFGQGLTCAFSLCKLFTQQLIMHLELVNLTLLLHKSRKDTKKMGKYFNVTNGKKIGCLSHY